MVDPVTALTLAAVAFAGGALGAAIGGLQAFSVAGVVIVVGEVSKLASGAAGAVGAADPAALGASGITAAIGLGVGFGPHVAFAGGVAAAAYAARSGDLDTGFEYHEAKNVTTALGTAPDVLAVGGAFGVLGLLFTQASVALALPWDPIAAAIVLSAFVHRVAFGYPLVGSVRGGLLDMRPFERRERRAPRAEEDGAGGATARDRPSDGDSGITPADGVTAETRYVVEPWLPHQYEWSSVAVLGLVVGVFAAFVTYTTGSPFLAFGLTAATLLFLCLGMERFPVTHHMALPASIAVVALVGAADPALLSDGTTPAEIRSAVTLHLAIAAGGVVGAVAGLFGELAQRALYAHADTHLDPPAAAIVLTTLLIALLDVAGVVSQNVIPTLGL